MKHKGVYSATFDNRLGFSVCKARTALPFGTTLKEKKPYSTIIENSTAEQKLYEVLDYFYRCNFNFVSRRTPEFSDYFKSNLASC
jgi:hypothetical protein